MTTNRLDARSDFTKNIAVAIQMHIGSANRDVAGGRLWFKLCHFWSSRAESTRGEIDDSGCF